MAVASVLMLCISCCSKCLFLYGPFFIVALNLSTLLYLHFLQHFFFEHLGKIYHTRYSFSLHIKQCKNRLNLIVLLSWSTWHADIHLCTNFSCSIFSMHDINRVVDKWRARVSYTARHASATDRPSRSGRNPRSGGAWCSPAGADPSEGRGLSRARLWPTGTRRCGWQSHAGLSTREPLKHKTILHGKLLL